VRFIVHGGAVLTTCANFIPRSPCALPILWAKEAGEGVHGVRVIEMLGLVAVVKTLDVHREQSRSPLCSQGLACVRCRSCLDEALSSTLRLPLDRSQIDVRDAACSSRTAKGHLGDSARGRPGLPFASVYENLNSTEPDIRSRLYTTPDINTEKAESQLQTRLHSHRKAVNSWLSERKSKASAVYCLAADKQDVVKPPASLAASGASTDRY
jgi:hypothetical protein